MTGSARTIRSPSTLTSTRSTPCVAGCWGPTLRTISSVWRPPVLARSGTRVRSSGTVPISRPPRRLLKFGGFLFPGNEKSPNLSRSSSQRAPGGCLLLVLRPRPGLVPADGREEVEVGAVELRVVLQGAGRTRNVAGRQAHVDRAVAHVHRVRRFAELAGDTAAKFLRIYPFRRSEGSWRRAHSTSPVCSRSGSCSVAERFRRAAPRGGADTRGRRFRRG